VSVGDLLRDIGTGIEKGAKVAGKGLATVGRAYVEANDPEPFERQRERQYKNADEATARRAQFLENQIALDDKYQTLKPEQRQALETEYRNLGKAAPQKSLFQVLHQALHPNGMVRQSAPQYSGNAAPPLGTAATDEANAEKLAESRQHPRQLSSTSQYFNSYAQSLGLNDSSEMTPEQWDTAIAGQKKAGRAPVQHHWAPVKFNGNLYMHDPATNEMKFVGTENDVTVHRGVQNVTQADGTILQIPVTTYTSKQSGKPITDEDGNPIQTLEPDNHPDNPSSGETKPQNAQGGVPKATPGGILRNHPRTGASPVNPPSPGGIPGARVVGSHGSPLYKSDMAQYTKVAEDANTKAEAYKAASAALASGSTASSDQELIYQWVRSNVQGAGRMTQAEFKQAAATGSLPLRAQSAWQKATTGKLPPELEQMFLADIKRASDTAQQEAAELRKKVEQPGNAPASTGGPNIGDVKTFPNGKKGKWDGTGYAAIP
jgi:hypothetical protein